MKEVWAFFMCMLLLLLLSREEGNPAGLSSCSGGLRPLACTFAAWHSRLLSLTSDVGYTLGRALCTIATAGALYHARGATSSAKTRGFHTQLDEGPETLLGGPTGMVQSTGSCNGAQSAAESVPHV